MIIKTVGGSKRLVYLCFDPERDRPLRDFFMKQGRQSDATWYVNHWSQPYDENDPMWLTTAASHIKPAEAVVVMLGPTTYMVKGVLKEITIAQVLRKHIYQIIPTASGSPHVIPGVGRIVRWEWKNVKRAIATAPRRGDSRSAYAS